IAVAEPALEVEFGQLVEDVVGDLTTSPEPVEVHVLGEDRSLDERRAEQVAGLLEHVPGVVDVKSGVVVSGPKLSIVPGPGAGRDLGSAVREIQRRIRAGVVLGPGMHIEYGGVWAEQQASFRGLAVVLLGAAAAVMLVLLGSFHSWPRTGAVMLVAAGSLLGV